MNRRDFLKFSSFLSAVFFVQVQPFAKKFSMPVEVETQGTIYRGTNNGHIYISRDAGRSWQRHIDMGAEYSIEELSLDRSDQVRARVGFAGHSFDLVLSSDGSCWQTA